MPSKVHEKYVASKFIKQWNKDNASIFIIDEDYLINRKDNQNPDIKILDVNNSEMHFDVEITTAEDAVAVESGDRASDEMDRRIRELLSKMHLKKWHFFKLNGDKVRKRTLVEKDLILLREEILKLKDGEHGEKELKEKGFLVINMIRQSDGEGIVTGLDGEKSKKFKDSDYYNLGYFERIEKALIREEKDLKKKKRNGLDFILVIEINASMHDEMKYVPIKENDVDYYSSNFIKYFDSFKEIYVVETSFFSKIYDLKNLSDEMLKYFHS